MQYKAHVPTAEVEEHNKARESGIINMYEQGQSLDEIANVWGGTGKQVQTVLDRAGVVTGEYHETPAFPVVGMFATPGEWTTPPEIEGVYIPQEIRYDLLNEAVDLTRNSRQEIYGSFYDNMRVQGEIMSILMRAGMTSYSDAHNAAIGYVVGKLVRAAHGALHKDNYVDGINYLAEAYEAEYNEREKAKVNTNKRCGK